MKTFVSSNTPDLVAGDYVFRNLDGRWVRMRDDEPEVRVLNATARILEARFGPIFAERVEVY
jgi:hypothetical protein